jgi:hypothetical protein
VLPGVIFDECAPDGYLVTVERIEVSRGVTERLLEVLRLTAPRLWQFCESSGKDVVLVRHVVLLLQPGGNHQSSTAQAAPQPEGIPAMTDLSVSLSLHLTGDEGDERWQARASWGRGPWLQNASCCGDGHHTPEAAANHGAELAAAKMGQLARALPVTTCGGAVLARSA